MCIFCIFQALDTLFAALHVSVIRILCSSYYILHISRHYISVGTFLLGTFKIFTGKTTLRIYTHVSHGHYLSTHVRLDRNMMTVHLRTVARAFLQISIGPAQQLHPRSCNPIKSCTTAGITICICAYRKCFACHLCQWLWLCSRRTLNGTSPFLHRRYTPSETAAFD